jgi:hypothetical protein
MTPGIDIGAIVLGLAALWARLEHRLTRLEDKVDALPCSRPTISAVVGKVRPTRPDLCPIGAPVRPA